jgi:hypothetical protein
MGHTVIEWNDQRWYFYRDYYRNRKGKLLHREKFIEAFGPLEPKLDVHHIDGDKLNNDLRNLVALSRSQHLKSHAPAGAAAWSTEHRSGVSREWWERKQPHAVTCHECKIEFMSTGQRAKFCSAVCRSADQRRRNPKPKKGREHLKRPARACAACGSEFRAADPRTVTCSRGCGVVYRSQRLQNGG